MSNRCLFNIPPADCYSVIETFRCIGRCQQLKRSPLLPNVSIHQMADNVLSYKEERKRESLDENVVVVRVETGLAASNAHKDYTVIKDGGPVLFYLF